MEVPEIAPIPAGCRVTGGGGHPKVIENEQEDTKGSGNRSRKQGA